MEWRISFSCLFVLLDFCEGFPQINLDEGDMGITCKTFKSMKGFERKNPPIMGQLCYEDGQLCQGLLGDELRYCKQVCCGTKADQNIQPMEIRCVAIKVGLGKTVQGFERLSPPLFNQTCREKDGASHCRTLLEPERSHCEQVCCRASRPTEKPHDGYTKPNTSYIFDDAKNLKVELEHYKVLTYTFQAFTAILFAIVVVLGLVLYCKRKGWRSKLVMQYLADSPHDVSPKIAVPGNYPDERIL